MARVEKERETDKKKIKLHELPYTVILKWELQYLLLLYVYCSGKEISILLKFLFSKWCQTKLNISRNKICCITTVWTYLIYCFFIWIMDFRICASIVHHLTVESRSRGIIGQIRYAWSMPWFLQFIVGWSSWCKEIVSKCVVKVCFNNNIVR